MVNHRKSWAGNVFVWLDLTWTPSSRSNEDIAFVVFL